MIVKVTVEHTIRRGKELQAMELIRELSKREFDHQADALVRGLLPPDKSQETKASECYCTPLKSVAQLSSLSNTPAKIRICMAA